MINKPGSDQPNVLQNRSIRVFKSSGLSIPKNQPDSFTACPSTVWADEAAFGVAIPVVPDDIEAVAPWLQAGTICFASSQASLSKGGLVVADRGENYVIAKISSFSESSITCDPFIGDTFEVDPTAVYPVVTINLK